MVYFNWFVQKNYGKTSDFLSQKSKYKPPLYSEVLPKEDRISQIVVPEVQHTLSLCSPVARLLSGLHPRPYRPVP